MAVFSFFGQISAQILDWHVNPSNPTATLDWDLTANPGSPTQAAPVYGWFNLSTNTFGTYTGTGGGVGAIANLSRDLSGNTSVNINGPTTVGMLLLGDLNAGNNYTLGGSGTLTFNTGNASHGLLNKVIGSNDTITVPTIAIVGALDINTNTGSLAIGSTFSGTGGLNFYGNSLTTLTGNNTTYTGTTTLYGWNSTSTSARVRLNAATGNALGSSLIVLGQGTKDYAGYTVLELQQGRTNLDQIKDTARLRFDGQGGRNAYFKTMGGDETVGSIWAPEGTSVIENMESETVNTNSVLTIGGDNSDSYFNGHIRNRSGGTGTGTLGITKNGTGSFLMAGGNVTYTGPTIINGGTLVLWNTTAFASAVTLNNNSVMEFRITGDMTWNDAITMNGTSSIFRTGGSNLTLDLVQTFNGAFRNQQGTLTLNKDIDFNGGLVMSGISSLTVNTGGAGSSFASLSQVEGGEMNISGSITVNGATFLSDFGGDTNLDNVTINAGANSTFLGTFTAARREVRVGATATFGSDIYLEGSSGGTGITTPVNNSGGALHLASVFSVANNGVINLTGVANANIYLNGSYFIIDNSGTNNTNRVADGFNFQSNGGTIRFFHANDSTNYSETLGTVTLASGMLTIDTSRSNGNSTLHLLGLTKANGTYSTVQFLSNEGTAGTFIGGSLGSDRNKVTIGSQAAGFMGGWASVLNITGTASNLEWAKYSASTGVTPFASTDYLNTSTNEATWATGQHVKLQTTGSGNFTLSTTLDRTIASLNLQKQADNSLTLTLGSSGTGRTLIIESGGILYSGGNSAGQQAFINTVTNTGVGVSRIMGGLVGGTYQLITTVHDPGRDLFITAVISDFNNSTSNATALVKSGTGRLMLGSTTAGLHQSNAYSNGTYILGGSILLRAPNATTELDGLLGATGKKVVLNGGTLRIVESSFNITASGALARNFQIGESGGTIDVDGSRVFNVTGGISGLGGVGTATQGVLSVQGSGDFNVSSNNNNLTGGLFKTGAGIVTFSGTGNTFGFIEHNQGVMTISGSGNQIGRLRFDQGLLTISGTTITSTTPGELILANGGNALDILTFKDNNVINRELRVNAGKVVFGDVSNSLSQNTYNPANMVIGNSGQIEIASANGIASHKIQNLTLGGGSLQFNIATAPVGYSFTLNALSGNNSSFIMNKGAADLNLVIESDLNLTFDGALLETGSGRMSLVKNGTGMLTLTHAESNFTGSVTVNAGVLNVTNLADGSGGLGAGDFAADQLVFKNNTALRFSGGFIGILDRSLTVGTGAEGVSFVAAGAGSTTAQTLAATFEIGGLHFDDVEYDGAGSAHIILTGSNTGNNIFGLRIGDNGASATSVTKTGTGTWVMDRANNTYTGTTTVMLGTLAVSADGALGAAGGPAVRLAGGTLELRNVNYLTVETLAMEGGVLAALSGTNRWNGDVYLGVNSTINVASGASLAIGKLSGRGGLTFTGEGTLIFEGSNYPTAGVPNGYSYGSIAVQAGTLVLRYTNATEKKLPGTNSLTLGGGRLGATLQIENDSGGSFSQLFEDVVTGTTLNAGAHRITRDANASNIWLKLNGLNRAVGATLELGGDNIITVDLLNINGILGGWATVVMPDGSLSWAFNSGVQASTSGGGTMGNPSIINGFGTTDSYVRGLSTSLYAVDSWGAETSGALAGFLRNTDVVTSGLTQTNENTNTLRFNQNASTILNLVGTNTVMSGGILVTPLVGGSGGAKYSKIQGGTITAGANSLGTDLLINQASVNGVFEIASVIANNPGNDPSVALPVGVGNGAYSSTKIGTRQLTLSAADIAKVFPGMQVSGQGITEGTYILAIDKATNTVTLSQTHTTTGGTTVTLQYNQKNGSIAANTAVLNLSGGQLTTNLYVGMIVTGTNIPAGTTITTINSTTQITLSNNIVPGSAGPFNFSASNGLIKNGDGMLLLTGLNTYTGVTVINEGSLAVLSLADGGVASSLGASSTAAGNLVFNGGTLMFAGETGLSNRGFTNNNEALFDVMREAATMSLTGSYVTANPISEYTLSKTGSGTLILGGASGGGFGHTRLVAEDGTLRLLLTSNDRFARSDISYLEVSGGTFEIFGNTGSFSQNMPKTLVVGAGASVIKVTAEGGPATVMNLNLMDGTGTVDRRSGGTVLFQENPTLNGVASVNGGVANIRLWLPAIYSNIIIPWAVYQDTSNFSQIGVNEFATSTPNLSANGIGEIVAASTLSLHDIGLNTGTGGPANVANWNGTIRNPSESDVVTTNFAGTTPNTNASVDTLRFFSATADSVVNVSTTFTINNGAILLANHIGNREKSIVGGTMTSGLVSGIGLVDLIIHNYNPANDFVIGSQLVNKVNVDNSISALTLVQTGTGTTTLTGSNTYTGKTYITGGVLKLDLAAALPTASNLVLDGGVLGLNYAGTFNRTIGTGAGQVQFTGNGGFAAYGADRTVSLSSNATLTWGLGGFVGGSNMLLFGANDATHKVLFTNSIDLGRFLRVVKVANGAAAVEAEMSGALGGPGGAIIKTGTGTLKLSGANTYTGSTVVADGTLIVNSGTNLGATGVELSTTVESTAGTTAILQFDGTAAPVDTMALPITVGNKNTDSINVVKTQEDFNLTGAVTINRTAAMGSTFLAPKAGTTATYSNITGTGGITIVDSGTGAGEGTVVLSGSNNYGTGGYSGSGAGITGGTVVREGEVLLRNSNALGSTTVELGDVNVPKSDVKWATDGRSVLSIGGNYDTDSDGIGLSGGAGAFLNVNQSLLGGTVALNDRVLVKDEMGNPELNGIYRISQINPDGTVNLVRATDFDGVGEMQYGSTVTVTNPSSSQNGTTWFMASPNVTTPNAPNTDPSIWLATAINANVGLQADLAGITVANNIDVNATNGTGSTVLGGSTGLTSGSATFSGAVTLQNVANGQAENKTVELTSSTGTATTDEIRFSGVISEAALEDMLSLSKTGTGRVTLSGNNTYKGTTTVSQGTLRAANNNALGGTQAGTTVNNGATLELSGNITIPSGETLTISGSGVGGGGALRNVSGDNNYNGVVNLAADARINSDAGLLTLGATPSSVTGASNLTFGGAGNIAVNGAIATGAGTVTKDGNGTVTLKGNSTYSGVTTVNAGTLLVNNTSGAGTGTGGITVKSGAVLGGDGFIAPNAGATITIESGGTLAVGTVGNASAVNLDIKLGTGSSLSLSGVLRLDMFSNDAGITDAEVDRLIFTEIAPGNKGTVTLGATATLQIGNMGGLTDALLTAGSSWKLIDWGGLAVTGTFSNLTNNTMLADLPTLTGGKYWDFSQLYTQGTVSIAVVPEPGRVVLLLFGMSALVLRRRRKLHA